MSTVLSVSRLCWCKEVQAPRRSRRAGGTCCSCPEGLFPSRSPGLLQVVVGSLDQVPAAQQPECDCRQGDLSVMPVPVVGGRVIGVLQARPGVSGGSVSPRRTTTACGVAGAECPASGGQQPRLDQQLLDKALRIRQLLHTFGREGGAPAAILQQQPSTPAAGWPAAPRGWLPAAGVTARRFRSVWRRAPPRSGWEARVSRGRGTRGLGNRQMQGWSPCRLPMHSSSGACG